MKASIATIPATPDNPNEDFAGLTPQGAVLLDGAGLSGVPTPCSHGVAWYTRHLGAALLTRLISNDQQDLSAMLAEAIQVTAAAHEKTCDLTDPGTPGATVVIVRLSEKELQYLVLADSVLLIEHGEGSLEVITDNREATIGRHYRQVMDNIRAGTQIHENARRDYVRAMQVHRNQPNGFWLAAANPTAATEAIVGGFPRDEVRSFALLSDGASRLADRFSIVDWRGLMALLAQDGPQRLLEDVRTAENTDPSGTKWPRGKVHDDATAIYWPLC